MVLTEAGLIHFRCTDSDPLLTKFLKLRFNLAYKVSGCGVVMELPHNRWLHERQQWLECRTVLQLAPRVN